MVKIIAKLKKTKIIQFIITVNVVVKLDCGEGRRKLVRMPDCMSKFYI